MSCLAENTVVEFLHGSLSADAVRAVESHVDRCPTCRRLLAQAARVLPPVAGVDAETSSRSPLPLPADLANAPTSPLPRVDIIPATITPEGSEPVDLEPPRLSRGATVGRYVIVEALGAGGMGIVYAAFDPELDRRVALKLLRTDLAAPGQMSQLRARLLREAQALARLSHPNVVSVYDVGTFQGRVFVAMEFIDGSTLKEWLRSEARPMADVLRCFVEVGRGVAAAHAAGLVHRDLKPDNVLIDRAGRVRVLDFGLARSAEHDTTQRTVAAPNQTARTLTLTRTGSVMGTPAYMAPEQFRGEPADARSDQFSFCVALYEGLYGERPFAGTTFEELAGSVLRGELRPVPAGSRVPARVRRALLRGLDLRPGHRHPSMDALLAALLRNRKVGWRRTLVAIGSLALVGAGLVSWREVRSHRVATCSGAERKLAGVWDAGRRQQVERAVLGTKTPYAAQTFAETARLLDGFASRWLHAHAEACEASARGEQSPELLDLRMQCLDRRLKDLSALTELLSRADAVTLERAVPAADALGDLTACADLELLRNRARRPADPAIRGRIAEIESHLATTKALRDAGRYQAGLEVASAAAEAARRAAWRPIEAEALFARGELEERTGQDGRAEQTMHEAILAAEAGRSDDVAADAWLSLVYTVGYKQLRAADAHKLAQRAAAAIERLGGNELLEAKLHSNVGTVFLGERRYREALDHFQQALPLYERRLPADHPSVATALDDIGLALAELDDVPQALEYHQRALSIRERVLGVEHPLIATSLNNVAGILWQQGRYDEALALFERCLLVQTKSEAPPVELADTHNNIGLILSDKGDLSRSQTELRRALALYEQTVGPESVKIGVVCSNLGNTLQRLRRYGEAEVQLERAIAIFRRSADGGGRDLAMALFNLGGVYFVTNRLEQALAQHRQALALYERALPPDHSEIGIVLTGLGNDLVELGRAAQAIAPLERAVALRERLRLAPGELADSRVALAHALFATGRDRARALRLAHEAELEYIEAGSGRAEELVELRRWLRSLRGGRGASRS
jgi:tetratricopeptide (TPR) repeat protein